MANLLTMYGSEADAEGKLHPFVLPTPSYTDGLKQTVSTIVNSGRTSEGKVIGQRVMDRDLVKLEVKWNWLLNSQWRDVLNAIYSSTGRGTNLTKGFYVWIRYYDMQLGHYITREFYPSDRSATPFSINPATGYPNSWINCTINFIDTGNPTEYID